MSEALKCRMSDVCWLVPPGRLSPRCEPCLVRAGVTSGGDTGAQVAATRGEGAVVSRRNLESKHTHKTGGG